MVRVKICGITSVSDARAALDGGADAIGLVFAKSSRRVNSAVAEKISKCVGPWISVVGVFVNEDPRRVVRIARNCGLSAVQLHGQEPPSQLGYFQGLRTIKAFHVTSGFEANMCGVYNKSDAFLFDTRIADKIGGTGQVFDWKTLKKIVFIRPVIISGGLHAGNVRRAVDFFRPYGVDVSSGVELLPGKKDPKKIREFIRRAKKNSL